MNGKIQGLPPGAYPRTSSQSWVHVNEDRSTRASERQRKGRGLSGATLSSARMAPIQPEAWVSSWPHQAYRVGAYQWRDLGIPKLVPACGLLVYNLCSLAHLCYPTVVRQLSYCIVYMKYFKNAKTEANNIRNIHLPTTQFCQILTVAIFASDRSIIDNIEIQKIPGSPHHFCMIADNSLVAKEKLNFWQEVLFLIYINPIQSNYSYNLLKKC